MPSFFRPDQLKDHGVQPHQLEVLIRYGAVERICWGLYHIVGTQPPANGALAIVCARSPGSIVCLHSALEVYGIHSTAAEANANASSNATVWLAVQHGKRKPPRIRDLPLPLRILRFSGTGWSFGVTWTEFDGVPARITTPARTIADCFRLERLAGAGAGVESMRDALGKGLVTMHELRRVERALPCRRLHALIAPRPAAWA